MIHQELIKIPTAGRGLIDITVNVNAAVTHSAIYSGLCNLFIQHTSASLLIGENADMTVQKDLEAFMRRLVPDGDPLFEHTAEGADDMPAHIRSVLTQTCLTIPISEQQLQLGTWQGIFLWEHRLAAHSRKIIVSVLG